MKSLYRYVLIFSMLTLITCNSSPTNSTIYHELSSFLNQMRSPNPQVMPILNVKKFRTQLMKNKMGAGYYLSYIFEAEEQNELSLSLLINEIKIKSPLSARAALRLIYLVEKNHTKLEFNIYQALLSLIKQREENIHDISLLAALGYTAFLQKKYEKSLNILKRIDLENLDLYPFSDLVKRTVILSEVAIKFPNWQENLKQFFFQNYRKQDIGLVLKWIYAEIPNYKTLIADYKLYTSLSHIKNSPNRHKDVYISVKNYIETQNKNWLNKQENLISLLTFLAEKAYKCTDTIQFLENYLPNLTGTVLLQAKLALGTLYFGEKNYSQTVQYLLPILTSSSPQKDDVDHYIIQTLSAFYKLGNTSIFIQKCQELAKLLRSNLLFRKFFRNILAELVRKNQFQDIYNLYNTSIVPRHDLKTHSHYAWVLSRALFHNMLDLVQHVNKQTVYNKLLADSLLVPWSYPSIMAYSVLNIIPPFYSNNELQDNLIPPINKQTTYLSIDSGNPLYISFNKEIRKSKLVNDDTYALGFLYYGLINYEKIYPEIVHSLKQMRERLSTKTLKLLGKELEHKGFFSDAILMMAKALHRSDFEAKRSDYTVLYPRGYINILEPIANLYGIKKHLLYGLVWNESLFQKSVVSHANAIGLGQLLKGTAKDMASLAGLKTFNLTDPHDNLVLTSTYLNWLEQRLSKIVYTLMAYNAGLSHVKTWLKNNHYPVELFIEAIPFSETHGYVHNIIADTAIYGYLYQGILPHKTITEFFEN